MAKKSLCALLILTFALAFQRTAPAQDKSINSQISVQDWQGLGRLKPGKAIVVRTKQGKEFAGKFADINGSRLGLALGFNILDFEQSDIAEVRRKSNSRKGRIIGAVVGLFAGASIGFRMDANQTGPPFSESVTPQITVLGGALGYLIGLHFDNKRKGKLLYQSQ